MHIEKSFLELEVLWKDQDIFELAIKASNLKFCGQTAVYDTSESLFQLSQLLIDYPQGSNNLCYKCGEKDGDSYFSMRFYPIGFSGKLGVEINLESSVATEYRKEEKSKLKMEIIVEPNAIDIFQKELFFLAKNETGKATLYGI